MINWAILGTGFISGTMADAIRQSPGSRLYALYGRDRSRIAAFAAAHPAERVEMDLDALLADPAVDAVYVGLPNHLHRQAVERIAAAGKAIVSEKSLTVSLADANALADAVRRQGVFFMEGLMYLNHPVIEALGTVLMSGRLGRIRAVEAFYAADIWRVANPLGGGTLYNLGCYPASLLHYVMQTAFGDEAFRERQTGGAGFLLPGQGTMVDAALHVRFAAGVLATIQCSDGYGMRHGFTVHGEKASLRFITNPWLPVAGENRMEITGADGAVDEVTVDGDHDAFGYQVRRVEACLAAGLTEPPRPSPRLEDSLAIMELLDDWQRHALPGSPRGEGR